MVTRLIEIDVSEVCEDGSDYIHGVLVAKGSHGKAGAK